MSEYTGGNLISIRVTCERCPQAVDLHFHYRSDATAIEIKGSMAYGRWVHSTNGYWLCPECAEEQDDR